MKKKAPLDAPETYRQLLLAKRAELLRIRPADPLELAPIGPAAPDDEAAMLHDQFVLLSLKQVDHQTLTAVNAALERLTAGEFGICQHCGRTIAPKRLQAIPWARWCIVCQDALSETDGRAA